jgi:hypothetical protein
MGHGTHLIYAGKGKLEGRLNNGLQRMKGHCLNE